MTKTEQIEAFLKKFKLVVNPADEPREELANDYDVVVLFDGKKVHKCQWGGGDHWVQNKVHGTDILQGVFMDAESYCRCSDYAGGDDTDALADFLDEFGYADGMESIKRGLRAFKGCKKEYEFLQPIVFFNCVWNDNDDAKKGSILEYLVDVCEYFDSDEKKDDLVEIDWDSYVEDYK